LARVHSLTGDERIVKLVAPMFDFVAHFFFGESSFSGTPGSRSTRNFFHFGVEYWAKRFPRAETLAFHSRGMLRNGHLLTPMDQEDHYLIYRVPEFLESYLVAAPEVSPRSTLPFKEAPFEKSYPHAGIHVWKTHSFYLVVNAKKGGAFKVLFSDGRVVEDAGWVLSHSRGLCTSSYLREDHEINRSERGVLVRGLASRMSHPTFRVGSFMAFRLVLLLAGYHPGIAKSLKRWIRSRIMTSKRAEARISFSRSIELADGSISVADHLRCSDRSFRMKVRQIHLGGILISRTVPQSRYFELIQLNQASKPLGDVQLRDFRANGTLEIRRSMG
jgi:hypothetical protein